MLKKILNHAAIDFEIVPVDPLLIKSGQATVGGVDMAFVRTYRFGEKRFGEKGLGEKNSGEKDEPFIPGSSLKGMIRSHAEKICRSLRDDPVPVCLPYVAPGKEEPREKRQASCGLSFEHHKHANNIRTLPSSDVYKNSCPACRLFGSHVYAGRFATSDAYLTDAFRQTGSHLFENRDGVAIDRITGGAAGGAKYDLEVLTRGEFGTSLEIRNFERWQLGLVSLVLRDMEDGLVRLGFGKSRGLGKFKAKITGFKIAYYHRDISRLKGLSGLCPEEESKQYGFFAETDDGPGLPDPESNGLRREYDLTGTWKEAMAPAVADLVAFAEKTGWPACLEDYLKWRK